MSKKDPTVSDSLKVFRCKGIKICVVHPGINNMKCKKALALQRGRDWLRKKNCVLYKELECWSVWNEIARNSI